MKIYFNPLKLPWDDWYFHGMLSELEVQLLMSQIQSGFSKKYDIVMMLLHYWLPWEILLEENSIKNKK